MIPASAFLEPPSPKANINPPITIAIRLNPRAIGPVKASYEHRHRIEPGARTLSEQVGCRYQNEKRYCQLSARSHIRRFAAVMRILLLVGL